MVDKWKENWGPDRPVPDGLRADAEGLQRFWGRVAAIKLNGPGEILEAEKRFRAKQRGSVAVRPSLEEEHNTL